jgi:hypothetical protein
MNKAQWVFKAGSNGMKGYVEYLKAVVVILTIVSKIHAKTQGGKEVKKDNIPGE